MKRKNKMQSASQTAKASTTSMDRSIDVTSNANEQTPVAGLPEATPHPELAAEAAEFDQELPPWETPPDTLSPAVENHSADDAEEPLSGAAGTATLDSDQPLDPDAQPDVLETPLDTDVPPESALPTDTTDQPADTTGPEIPAAVMLAAMGTASEDDAGPKETPDLTAGAQHRPATDEEMGMPFPEAAEDLTAGLMRNGESHSAEDADTEAEADAQEDADLYLKEYLTNDLNSAAPSSLPRDDRYAWDTGDEPQTPTPELTNIHVAAGQDIDEVVKVILERPFISERVSLDLIDFHPDNRILFNQQELEELSANIADVGVIHDIILRPLPGGRYELVCGERRVRASRIAGKLDIAAKIYEMTDKEARQIRANENGQRKNLHPMEEALRIEEMKGDFPTPELIAAKLAKPVGHVKDRLKLLSLVTDGQEIFLNNAISFREAQQLASFEDKVQQDFIKRHLSTWKTKGQKFTDLQWEFDKLKGSLKNPPFDMKDPDLNPEMGLCALCPKNSGCQQSLFVELAADPVCLKQSCYQIKTDRQLVKNVTAAVEKNKPMAIVSDNPLTDEQKALIKDIPGTEGLEFFLERLVYEVKKPQPPQQDKFKDGSGKLKKKEFDEQTVHHQEALAYQAAAIKDRKIFRAILIQKSGKVESYMFTRDSKASPTGQSGKVGLIQEDIKKGIVTTRQLEEELVRVRDNEESAAKKDATAMAAKVHATVEASLESKETPVQFHDLDMAITYWLLLRQLPYKDKHETTDRLLGKTQDRKTPEQTLKALQSVTKDDAAYLIRKVFLESSETATPGTEAAFLVGKLAEAIGIDCTPFQQEIDNQAKPRLDKFKTAESSLLKKIQQKRKKQTGKPAKEKVPQD